MPAAAPGWSKWSASTSRKRRSKSLVSDHRPDKGVDRQSRAAGRRDCPTVPSRTFRAGPAPPGSPCFIRSEIRHRQTPPRSSPRLSGSVIVISSTPTGGPIPQPHRRAGNVMLITQFVNFYYHNRLMRGAAWSRPGFPICARSGEEACKFDLSPDPLRSRVIILRQADFLISSRGFCRQARGVTARVPSPTRRRVSPRRWSAAPTR